MLKTALKKIYANSFYPVLLLGIHLTLIGTVIFFIDYFSKAELENILKKWVPGNLKLNFFLIMAGIIICHQDILTTFKKFKNKKGVYLLLLFIFAFSVTFFVTPRTHRIFYDEDIYANTGQNIALTNQTGYCSYGTFEYDEYYPHWITYNKEPSGWPYLISLVFKIFGTNEFYAFVLNNFIFSASVLLVFFITQNLTGNDVAAFLSGLAYAVIPHNLTWSNTTAAEPSTAFFSGLTVLLLIIFFKTGKNRHLLLLALIIPFACQMRPESILLVPLSFTAFIIFSPKTLADRRLWTFAVFIAALIIPNLLHIYAVSGHSWGAEGAKFSIKFFETNIGVNGIYYLDNQAFPVLLTAFAVVGLLWSRPLIKWRLMIFCWFLLFWGIFLFFYAGSYQYGADVRFSLLSFMPLTVLAGMGACLIIDKLEAAMPGNGTKATINQHLATGLIALIMLFSFVQFLPLIRQVGQEAWGSRYDHQFAKEFIEKIPRRSIVLTHNPTMFLLWGQNAIQTYAGTNHPEIVQKLMEKYFGHVYFHHNYWCNTKTERNQRLCRSIKERYLLEEIAVASEQDYVYSLYKMSFKGEETRFK